MSEISAISVNSSNYNFNMSSSVSMKIRQLENQKETAEEELKKSENNPLSSAKLNNKIMLAENQIERLENSENNKDNNNVNSDNKNLSEAEKKRRFDSYECETCKNRKYQDQSDDSGVSFQTPTKINPAAAEGAVRSHENEHVTRNLAAAEREDKKVVSQTVSIKHAICPECGDTVVTGGVTRTVTKGAHDETSNINSNVKRNPYNVGMFDNLHAMGNALNTVA